MRKSLALGLAFVAVAVLTSCSYKTIPANPLKLTPLDIPFPLEATDLGESPFTIDLDGSYEVVLKITRTRDEPAATLAECLMGWDPGNAKWGHAAYHPACQAKPVVSVEWRLASLDGRVSEQGQMSGIADGVELSSDETVRPLTAFSASRGQRYRLAIRTSGDARALAFAHPRIVVQTTGATNENEMVKTIAFPAIAALAGVFGVIVLIWNYWGQSENW